MEECDIKYFKLFDTSALEMHNHIRFVYRISNFSYINFFSTRKIEITKRLRRQLTADCFLLRRRAFLSNLITAPAPSLLACATLSTFLISTPLAHPSYSPSIYLHSFSLSLSLLLPRTNIH